MAAGLRGHLHDTPSRVVAGALLALWYSLGCDRPLSVRITSAVLAGIGLLACAAEVYWIDAATATWLSHATTTAVQGPGVALLAAAAIVALLGSISDPSVARSFGELPILRAAGNIARRWRSSWP